MWNQSPKKGHLPSPVKGIQRIPGAPGNGGVNLLGSSSLEPDGTGRNKRPSVWNEDSSFCEVHVHCSLLKGKITHQNDWNMTTDNHLWLRSHLIQCQTRRMSQLAGKSHVFIFSELQFLRKLVISSWGIHGYLRYQQCRHAGKAPSYVCWFSQRHLMPSLQLPRPSKYLRTWKVYWNYGAKYGTTFIDTWRVWIYGVYLILCTLYV